VQKIGHHISKIVSEEKKRSVENLVTESLQVWGTMRLILPGSECPGPVLEPLFIITLTLTT
jgi:hypothetical protein